MGNPKRGRDSRGNLRKLTGSQRLDRGSKRMGRAERRGDVGFVSRWIGSGWISTGGPRSGQGRR